MNLIGDKWIPVLMKSGAFAAVGLSDVFRDGGSIADLSANPCQRIALMRLLICIAQAALKGPTDEADWEACRPRIADASLCYLDRWKDRFGLFGGHAFLQADGLAETCNAVRDKLDFALSSGNKHTLFDHGATPDGRLLESARQALNLLVYQMLSPGGLIGNSDWNGKETGRSSEHAPCIEGSMLHTFIRGDNLLETVHCNLLCRDAVEAMPNFTWGTPCWEIPMTADAEALGNQPNTYLGRLVPVSRAIRLAPTTSKVTLANGLSYPKLPENRDPFGTVRKIDDKKGEIYSYLPVNPEKHPWRELASILTLHQADMQGGAMALSHLRGLEKGKPFDIWTGGLCAEKSKLIDMAEWVFSLNTDLLDETVLGTYQKGVSAANSGNGCLREAIRAYAETLKSEPAVWRDTAQRMYWAALDAKARCLTECVADGEDLSRWHREILSVLQDTYTRVCPHETPRQMQAYVKGEAIVNSWKWKTDKS